MTSSQTATETITWGESSTVSPRYLHGPNQQSSDLSYLLKAPAQDALEYQLVKFDSSIYGGETEYQGPPNEHNNKLWKNLYSRKFR